MCSHHKLPENFRTLKIDLFLSFHQEANTPKTYEEEDLEHLRAEIPRIEEAMDWLRTRFRGTTWLQSRRWTPGSTR